MVDQPKYTLIERLHRSFWGHYAILPIGMALAGILAGGLVALFFIAGLGLYGVLDKIPDVLINIGVVLFASVGAVLFVINHFYVIFDRDTEGASNCRQCGRSIDDDAQKKYAGLCVRCDYVACLSNGASDQVTTGALCERVSPEHLHSLKNALAMRLADLPIVREDLLMDSWRKGPIDTVSGSEAAAETVITRVQEEARAIRRIVAGIQLLTVSIKISDWMDVGTHEGPRDHVWIAIWREFHGGRSDFIPHFVTKVGKDSFQFAYMRL